MTRDDLFNTNASIVRDLASAIGRVAPEAHILVISNPVNSTVPIVAETLTKAGVFNPKRVFGVTTLDVVRAARFLAEVSNADPASTPVTVIGGHSGPTIVPLLSQSSYGKAVKGEPYSKIVHRIQYGGDEVVKAKDGAGSATLSMAYAGAKFANSLLRGLNGEKGVVTPTFVKSPLFADKGIEYFSSNVELGPNGVEKIHEIGPLSPEEEELLAACLPELKKNIEKGKAFVGAA
jgi:malate dehydrogenase